MKAFIAILLVAAVSGQMTTGMDKNIMDYLRYRTMYPQGQQLQGQQQYQGQYQRGLPTTAALYNYIQQLQQTVNAGDMTTTTTQGQQQMMLPSTTGQQVNMPSDVFIYTLRQLYTLPLFQDYIQIPLFREFLLNVPAFQKYIVSPAFQKYWTQAEFKQFFVDSALFYKYIFPIVIQYQHQQQQYNGVVTVPEIFRGQQQQQMNNNYYGRYQQNVLPNMYNNLYNNVNYNNMLNKQILPQYNNELFNFNTKFDTIKTMYPEVYGNGYYGKVNRQQMYNRNILDILMTPKMTTTTQEVYPTFGGIMGQQVQTPFNTMTTDKTAELYLEKIFMDLIKGKVDINDLKDMTNTNTQTLLNEQINKIVDPITGEIKIVEEKIVKPFETIMTTEGEQHFKQDNLVKKILLNKAIFNKL